MKDKTDDCLKKHEQRLRQEKGDLKKQEILKNMHCDKEKINKLKEGIETIRSTQESIADIIQKTRAMAPMSKEKKDADDMELDIIVNGKFK